MCNDIVKRNTPEEMIAVIKAHQAGKPVEYHHAGIFEKEWNHIRDPSFNFGDNAYRVKEEEKFTFIFSSFRRLPFPFDGEEYCHAFTVQDITESEALKKLNDYIARYPNFTFSTRKFKEVK